MDTCCSHQRSPDSIHGDGTTEVDRPGVVCDQAGDGGLGDGAGQVDDLVAVEPGSESKMDTRVRDESRIRTGVFDT